MCAALLAACGMGTSANAQEQNKSLQPKSAVKPALDHSVYDKWETLGGYAITDNGQWAAYYCNREENDGSVNVINLTTEKTITIPRGARMKFSPEGNHLVFTIRPTHAQQKEAKLKKRLTCKVPCLSYPKIL